MTKLKKDLEAILKTLNGLVQKVQPSVPMKVRHLPLDKLV